MLAYSLAHALHLHPPVNAVHLSANVCGVVWGGRGGGYAGGLCFERVL